MVELDCMLHLIRYVTRDGGSGILASARTTAARRFRAVRGGGEVRPPELGDVGRRPDGGAACEVPALRLRQAEGSGQRPTGLLEGPRLDAALRDVPGGRSDLGGRAADLPP